MKKSQDFIVNYDVTFTEQAMKVFKEPTFDTTTIFESISIDWNEGKVWSWTRDEGDIELPADFKKLFDGLL